LGKSDTITFFVLSFIKINRTLFPCSTFDAITSNPKTRFNENLPIGATITFKDIPYKFLRLSNIFENYKAGLIGTINKNSGNIDFASGATEKVTTLAIGSAITISSDTNVLQKLFLFVKTNLFNC
jgi:hypothetical protein